MGHDTLSNGATTLDMHRHAAGASSSIRFFGCFGHIQAFKRHVVVVPVSAPGEGWDSLCLTINPMLGTVPWTPCRPHLLSGMLSQRKTISVRPEAPPETCFHCMRAWNDGRCILNPRGGLSDQCS